jgi:crotonobetainyl-CoA:carnitine CoA-transferase CaiB-like acyl-CoA transferase
MSLYLAVYELSGKIPPRTGFSHSLIAPYGSFNIGDGSKIVISVQNQREWAKFCEIVLLRSDLANLPEYENNTMRSLNRESLNNLIESIFSTLSRHIVTERLIRANIAFGAINEIPDLEKHPALRRAYIDTDKGFLQVAAPALRVSDEAIKFGRVPNLGEHNLKIRAEFST